MIILRGAAYFVENGIGLVSGPNGEEWLEFAVDFEVGINIDLHNRLEDIGLLEGKEVDVAGLPDSVTVDGTPYDITHEADVRPELIALQTALVEELSITGTQAKRICRAVCSIVKRSRRWA